MRVQTFPCSLAKADADALKRESGRHYLKRESGRHYLKRESGRHYLKRESGRHYTTTMVWHYRSYRRTGHWLSTGAAERLEDYRGGPTTLHAHSRAAAQQGFSAACKVARRQQQMGLDLRYPHRRRCYRTTTWQNTGSRVRDGALLLARARGLEPVRVALPANFAAYPASAYQQVELVWDRAGRRYHWHVTLQDGAAPAPAPGSNIIAVDLGEIHPAVITDGTEAVVVTARRLRATRQYTAKRLAEIQAKQSAKTKGSSRWKRLQARKKRFLAQQERRIRAIEHKVSRAVVDYVVERKGGTIAMGDVRDIAEGKRLPTKTQQTIGLWSHGKTREYITYKAQAAGIVVELIDEHDTAKTCPRCEHQYKPKGRVYCCPRCGLVAHRDAVGSVNILSRRVHGKLASILPPPLAATKYRYPAWQGKRSPLDTGELARLASVGREAAGL